MYIIGAIAVLLVAWYVFSGNGIGGQAGFDAVKNGINNAATEQRAVSDELGTIGAGIGDSRGTVDGIEQSNHDAQAAINNARIKNKDSRATIQDSRERLERCQSIIDRVEKGTGQGNSENQTGK